MLFPDCSDYTVQPELYDNNKRTYIIQVKYKYQNLSKCSFSFRLPTGF